MTFKYQIIQLYIWGRELQRFDDLQKNTKQQIALIEWKKNQDW